jgi:hypothetical protein
MIKNIKVSVGTLTAHGEVIQSCVKAILDGNQVAFEKSFGMHPLKALENIGKSLERMAGKQLPPDNERHFQEAEDPAQMPGGSLYKEVK